MMVLLGGSIYFVIKLMSGVLQARVMIRTTWMDSLRKYRLISWRDT